MVFAYKSSVDAAVVAQEKCIGTFPFDWEWAIFFHGVGEIQVVIKVVYACWFKVIKCRPERGYFDDFLRLNAKREQGYQRNKLLHKDSLPRTSDQNLLTNFQNKYNFSREKNKKAWMFKVLKNCPQKNKSILCT